MCTTCGCGEGEVHIEGHAAHEHDYGHAQHYRPHVPAHNHGHGHAHGHGHDHGGGDSARRVQMEQDILSENNRYAQVNRMQFGARGVFALNLVSSPGSGKTSLLVRTIEALKNELPIAVIEGDQQTANDADRIRAAGAPAVQINTGKGCHLDAHMVGHALERLTQQDGGVLMIENVGNLVCPASFDLGEAHKVVVLSVTEGEDKPLKYPDMFAAASLMLLNKTDLLPHLDFDVEAALDYARRVNPRIGILQVSARTGEGMSAWLDWIRAGCQAARALRRETVQP
ncbi:MAG: hydrogenase nickel incorporation protein HypB [Gallionellaceae bacterium]|jgi:hydrogenase nickel incorporation protein HypB|nr:hydrogenase nickel incorporation protein HypB [Gallionellaceae bacterium]